MRYHVADYWIRTGQRATEMIVETDSYMVRSASSNSNDIYWEQDLYPAWSAISTFIHHPVGRTGGGTEPHYHDADEVWLFATGRGEAWLDGVSHEVTPGTLVYTPMGVVHRFQMFSDWQTASIVTRLERQKRPIHILVEEHGPPEPTVPGFVAPGELNVGPIPDPGSRCPFSEIREVEFVAGQRLNEETLRSNESWLVQDGTVTLTIDGWTTQLSAGDVAVLRTGVVRGILSDRGALVALARERTPQI
jgi:mannose-6-phosphate isomerase-like protein (cupin superfamily)